VFGQNSDKQVFFTKYNIGIQLVQCQRVVDNSIFADNNNNISNSYKLIYDNFNNQNGDVYSRDYFGLSDFFTNINIKIEYKFDSKNSISFSIESINKIGRVFFNDTLGGFGRRNTYSDLLLCIAYYRTFYITKILNFKIGTGIGLAFNDKDEYNLLFSKTRFSNELYNNNPAYFFSDGKRVLYTIERYNLSTYLIVSPKIQIDFKIKKHSTISLVSGMYFNPIKNNGITAIIEDVQTNRKINIQNFDFYNLNYYFGIGYTFGWGKKHNNEEFYTQ
jgi:hypothetical protein